MAIGVDHSRQQLFLGVVPRRVADQALLLGELLVQQKGIQPVELSLLVTHGYS